MIIKELEIRGKFLTDTILPSKIKFYPDVTILIGHNGCGKTTIMELIRQMIEENDLDEDLKERIDTVILLTDQGRVTYDPVSGLSKHLQSQSVIRYKEQINSAYLPSPEEAKIIMENEVIRGRLEDYLVDKVPVIDPISGNLVMKFKDSESMLPLSKSSMSLKNLLMMYLFAHSTEEGDILLLEHPEEHLDIVKQESLLDDLIKLSRGQIIITTHAPSILPYKENLRNQILSLDLLIKKL